MKILAVSDMEVDRLYSAKASEYFRDVELVLGCGDLPYEYLEFLVCTLNVPLLYVPGNHDPAYNSRNRAAHAEGCQYLDRKVKRVKGLNIAGIGGSIRYKPDSPNQYTQADMKRHLLFFSRKLFWHRLRNGNSLDFVIAHSPPLGVYKGNTAPPATRVGETMVINVYPYRILEV